MLAAVLCGAAVLCVCYFVRCVALAVLWLLYVADDQGVACLEGA